MLPKDAGLAQVNILYRLERLFDENTKLWYFIFLRPNLFSWKRRIRTVE